MTLALRPNECMVRAGLLVGLAVGMAVIGYANIGAAIGIFAVVQLVNVGLDLWRGRRAG